MLKCPECWKTYGSGDVSIDEILVKPSDIVFESGKFTLDISALRAGKVIEFCVNVASRQRIFRLE